MVLDFGTAVRVTLCSKLHSLEELLLNWGGVAREHRSCVLNLVQRASTLVVGTKSAKSPSEKEINKDFIISESNLL